MQPDQCLYRGTQRFRLPTRMIKELPPRMHCGKVGGSKKNNQQNNETNMKIDAKGNSCRPGTELPVIGEAPAR